MDRHFKATITKCKKNNRKAQFELYQLCYAPLMKICWRYKRNKDDALALLNEGFLKILLSLESYKEAEAFFPWANTIMVRTAIDEFRKTKTYRTETELTEDYNEFGDVEQPTDTILQELSADDIKQMVFELNEVERMVFTLYELEGYHHKEIAEQLKVTVRTTKRYLKAAKQNLKKKIAKHTEVKKVS